MEISTILTILALSFKAFLSLCRLFFKQNKFLPGKMPLAHNGKWNIVLRGKFSSRTYYWEEEEEDSKPDLTGFILFILNEKDMPMQSIAESLYTPLAKIGFLVVFCGFLVVDGFRNRFFLIFWCFSKNHISKTTKRLCKNLERLQKT